MEKMKKDEEMQELQKKLQQIQFDCEMAESALKESISNLESSEKQAIEAEAEVQSLTKSIRLQEDDLEQTETRLQEATFKLEEAIKAADESERTRKVLETRSVGDVERIGQLEEQLKEAKFIAEEADRKCDDATRKLAITEVDLERSEHRLESEDYKILALEEELMVVGNNVKSLEISEQEGFLKEEMFEESLRDLSEKLRMVSILVILSMKSLMKSFPRLTKELPMPKAKWENYKSRLIIWKVEFLFCAIFPI